MPVNGRRRIIVDHHLFRLMVVMWFSSFYKHPWNLLVSGMNPPSQHTRQCNSRSGRSTWWSTSTSTSSSSVPSVRGGSFFQDSSSNPSSVTNEEVDPIIDNGEKTDLKNTEDDTDDKTTITGTVDVEDRNEEQQQEEEDVQEDADEDETATTSTMEQLDDADDVVDVDVDDEGKEALGGGDFDGRNVGGEDSIEYTDEAATEIATTLRIEGKDYHDRGDFTRAAILFQQAADTLKPRLRLTISSNSNDNNNDGSNDAVLASMATDYATCRLHQALCHLKSESYELCVEACTDVLQDSEENGEDDETASTTATTDIPTMAVDTSPAVRARAYHRRAKAKLALGDKVGALHDARTAAFLGDGKAVAFYGKLMRGDSSSSSLSPYDDSIYSSTGFNPWLSPQRSSPSSSSPNHSALLQSLMSKSSSDGAGGDSQQGLPDFSPLSLLMGGGGKGGIASGLLGALRSGGGSEGGGGLAKSVLSNLSKRLDDESTQIQISNFLQNTNKAQLANLAVLAGVDGAVIHDSPMVDRIIGVCNGVTPRKVRWTVRTTKVTVYMVRILQRILKVIDKYKGLLTVLFIFQWAKSATLRPIPIDKRAARQATKEALRQAMKSSRG